MNPTDQVSDQARTPAPEITDTLREALQAIACDIYALRQLLHLFGINARGCQAYLPYGAEALAQRAGAWVDKLHAALGWPSSPAGGDIPFDDDH